MRDSDGYDQERDYLAFLELLPELMQSSEGECVVVHNCKPVKFFNSFERAAVWGLNQFGPKHFIAQEVKPEEVGPMSRILAT